MAPTKPLRKKQKEKKSLKKTHWFFFCSLESGWLSRHEE
jgi:hypothetical protein